MVLHTVDNLHLENVLRPIREEIRELKMFMLNHLPSIDFTRGMSSECDDLKMKLASAKANLDALMFEVGELNVAIHERDKYIKRLEYDLRTLRAKYEGRLT